MRAGANILSPINVSVKFPPGTVVDYAYNVFYQVNNFKWVYISFSTVASNCVYNWGFMCQEVLLSMCFWGAVGVFFSVVFLFCDEN